MFRCLLQKGHVQGPFGLMPLQTGMEEANLADAQRRGVGRRRHGCAGAVRGLQSGLARGFVRAVRRCSAKDLVDLPLVKPEPKALTVTGIRGQDSNCGQLAHDRAYLFLSALALLDSHAVPLS